MLIDGELIDVVGLIIIVLVIFGYIVDLLLFVFDDVVLIVDIVLGCGIIVIDKEDGSLVDYLELLYWLCGLGWWIVLLGYGLDLFDLEVIVLGYLLYWYECLEQICVVLWDFGDDVMVCEVVEYVYFDVDEKFWNVVEWLVQV